MHVDTWLLSLVTVLLWTPPCLPQQPPVEKKELRIGAVLPTSTFMQKKLMSTISYELLNKVVYRDEFSVIKEEYKVITNRDKIQEEMVVEIFMDTPQNPSVVLSYLCNELLNKQVNTLIFMRDEDSKGISAPTTNFIMKYANSIGIPVIAWVGDNSGLAQTSAESIVIQMTPSVTHQCIAMMELLKWYKWKAFTIVTGYMTGNKEFIDTLRDMADKSPKEYSFEVLSVIRIESDDVDTMKKQLISIRETESRVILLYASSAQGRKIMAVAKDMNLTEQDFTWIVSRAITAGSPRRMPYGLLGVDFDFYKEEDDDPFAEAKQNALEASVMMWAQGMKQMIEESRRNKKNISLVPNFNCDDPHNDWPEGRELYRKMINVSIENFGDGDAPLEFNQDGTLKYSSLAISNLNPDYGWKKIGKWSTEWGLEMDDIYWPGNQATPPKGRPAKYHLKVVTLLEPPYVIYSDPDPMTGKCPSSSFLCRIKPLNITRKFTNATADKTLYQCCSGFCIDLLQLLAESIGFDFELFEVEDGKWGAPDEHGNWVGLVRSIMDEQADMAMTSLKITPERNSVVDFSVPFLETGITIIVGVRDGVITPTAFLKPFDQICWVFILVMCIQVLAVAVFLFEWMSPSGFNFQKQPPREPYDYPSWCLILVFSVHACGAAIFIFEWLSPSGLDRGTKPIREHKFSLFRSFWLIWAMLFGAAVNVDNPRGVSSRCLANIWALFAVVFTASYTANLATFMITKDDYDRLTGIDDPKLQNAANGAKPPFKFGTIFDGSTHVNIRNNFPKMSGYMDSHNVHAVSEGVKKIKEGELNAFIYDATVLEYKASHDDKCKLKTVGTWYAMTGYGVAFPKGSKWISQVDSVIRRLQHEGTLERLQKFWLAGACKYKSDEEAQSKSIPLGILNFTSAFILLASGMLLGGLLLLLEHIYFKCFRAKLRKLDKCGCCGLISLSMGKSLTFEQSVREAIELQKHHRCKNPVCETHTWKLKHELDLALLKVERLGKQMSDSGMAPDNRAVWRKPRQTGNMGKAAPQSIPSIGWKNEVLPSIPNHKNTASPPCSYRLMQKGSCAPYPIQSVNQLGSYERLDPSHRQPVPPPPSTPPSAWQNQPQSFQFPPQPHSVAGVTPLSTLPPFSSGNPAPQEPYYCTPIKHHSSKRPERVGSKSLPSSPVKRQSSSGGYGYGSEREDSPHRSGYNYPHDHPHHQHQNANQYYTAVVPSQQRPSNMTRTTSFPESPNTRRRTRMHQGNMYMQVNKSEPHIFEKETVL